MVDRRQKVEFDLASQVPQSDPILYQPNPGRPQPVEQAPDTASQALSGLLSLGEQVVKKNITQEAQESYLEGQLAAQRGESAEEIASDPFVRPFANMGYRDEQYRTVQTKEVEDFERWLQTEGRALAPDSDKVSERVRSLNSKVSAAMTPGMSGRSRVNALGSQVKTTEALVARHNKAHKEFLVEQASQAILPQGNQIIKDLVVTRADDDPTSHQLTVERAAQFFVDLKNDPRLDKEMREEIGVQFLDAMLNKDQRYAFEQIQDAGYLDDLPFDVREKLTTAARTSKKRTNARDLTNQYAGNVAWEERFISGDAPMAEYENYVERNSGPEGFVTEQYAMNLLRKRRENGGDAGNQAAIIEALQRRDDLTLGELGSDVPKAMAMYDKALRSQRVGRVERLGAMVGVALDMGHFPKAYGDMVDEAITAIGSSAAGEEIHQDHVEALNLVTSLVTQAEGTREFTASTLMEPLNERSASALAYMINDAEQGIAPERSLRNFLATRDDLDTTDQARRRAQVNEFRERYQSEINKRFPISMINAFMPFRGERLSVAYDDHTQYTISEALWEETRRMENQAAFQATPTEKLIDVAASRVRSRVIPLDDEIYTRPLILGRNVKPADVFGTNDNKLVGRVLSERYPAGADGIISTFKWDNINKTLQNVKVEESTGNVVGFQTVPLEELRGDITREQELSFAMEQAGSIGKPIQVGDRTLVVDGRNTAGIAKQAVLGMRELILSTSDPVSTDGPGASSEFRDSSDKALSVAKRAFGANFGSPAAISALGAAVYVEGWERMEGVGAELVQSLEKNDLVAFEKALQGIQDPAIRAELKRALPVGRRVDPGQFGIF